MRQASGPHRKPRTGGRALRLERRHAAIGLDRPALQPLAIVRAPEPRRVRRCGPRLEVDIGPEHRRVAHRGVARHDAAAGALRERELELVVLLGESDSCAIQVDDVLITVAYLRNVDL